MLSGVSSEMFDLEKCKAREFIIIANVYGKRLNRNGQGHCHKTQFLTELSNCWLKVKYPLIIGGDFNILLFNNEKNEKLNINKIFDMFNRTINTHELKQMKLVGRKFT
jgi:hypothetical protein